MGSQEPDTIQWLNHHHHHTVVVEKLQGSWATRKIVAVKWSEVTQSCPTLSDPMDCSLPGSSVHGIFQARVLEWVVISFSRGSSQPRDRTQVSCIACRRFTIWATREAPVAVKGNLKWCCTWRVICKMKGYQGSSYSKGDDPAKREKLRIRKPSA